MHKTIITILIFAYILIGIFMSGCIREEWEKPSLLDIIFWPIFICIFLIFGLMNGMYVLGQKLKEYFRNK